MGTASEYRVKACGTVVMSWDVFRAIPADRVVNLLGTTGPTRAKKRSHRTLISRQDTRIDVLLNA